MNICILKENLNIGGTERSAANISKVLQEDHEVCLALYDGAKTKYTYGGRIVDFHCPPKNTFIGKVINTILRDIKLKKLIKTEKPDVLYTFTSITNWQTRNKYSKTIKIVSARDFGIMKKRYREYSHALLNSDAIICNSECIKNFYLSYYPNHTDKVYTVYNYINVEEICTQSKETTEASFANFLQAHSNTIVSVGRFCKEKGFEYLIEAFAQARKIDSNLGLVLVGDGKYKQKYLDSIERLNIKEHVFFTGFQKNPYKYISKCNAFVLSSLSEGFPNVLAEAMALKLPVIATNCLSGPAEILRLDKDYSAVTDRYQECDFGIITPRITENDNEQAIAELSRAIATLLSSYDKMQHYSILSEQRAKEFSKETTRMQLNLILNKLVEKKRK